MEIGRVIRGLAALACAASAVVSCGAPEQADPFAPGCTTEEWARVTAVQRYPLYNASPPDWEALARDESSVVRAATALGIGRTEDADLVPLLLPLLEEGEPLTRHCALWALLNIESPAIKEPLLRVLGTWENLERGITDFELRPLWDRAGIPANLAESPLPHRRDWLEHFDAAQYGIDFIEPMYPGKYVILGLANSEIDAGDPLEVRVRVTKTAGSDASSIRLTEPQGRWYAIDRWLSHPGNDVYDNRLHFPADLLHADRDTTVQLARAERVEMNLTVATNRKPLKPGVYLFKAFWSSHPVFVRVRRDTSIEQQLPELLGDVAENVEIFGDQRVRAAVPAMIELFEKRGAEDGFLGFALAKALGQIGDPRAAPVLLAHPHLRNRDVRGDTSEDLREFGPGAFPHYEERILHWKKHIEREEGAYGLAIALNLLGSGGSKEVDEARLALIEMLLPEIAKGPPSIRTVARARGPLGRIGEAIKSFFRSLLKRSAKKTSPDTLYQAKRAVFQAAIVASASKHPKEAAHAILSVRKQPALPRGAIDGLNRLTADQARPILSELLRRLRKRPGMRSRLQNAILQTIRRKAPEMLYDEASPVVSREEALTLLDGFWYLDPARQRAAVARLGPFVTAERDPQVELELAKAYYRMGAYAKCAATIDEMLNRFEADLRENEADARYGQAYYYRGQSRVRLGDVELGEGDLEKARELFPPDYAIDDSTAESLPETVADVSGLASVKVHRLLVDYVTLNDENRYVEFCERWCFWIDPMRRLHRFDPVSRERATAARLVPGVRDFMALDRSRVFVAFTDGTAALYEDGRDEAVWRRPFSLGLNSYLSASTHVIIAADEEGTLHAIEPESGTSRWTRQVAGAPWPEQWWRSHRGRVQLHGDVVLVPDHVDVTPSRLDCLRADTGETLWSHRSPFGVAEMAVSDELVVLADAAADLAALTLADGSVLWGRDLHAEGGPVRIACATQEEGQEAARVYVSVGGDVWRLSEATGDTVWHWRWQCLSLTDRSNLRGKPSMHLAPTDLGVCCVVTWMTEQDYPSCSTDVAFVSGDGQLQFQATFPPDPTDSDYIRHVFVDARRLYILRDSLWEVWDWTQLAARRGL
ncbi:MAG TPA: PQQ-binding-like beta-propeller repeat protein [Candidatus Hydrogenedentes bacterium]|nr:PQQ-binding-like beta-propeller repeat protein [Candidatus Hydrogenedentota bacterium]